MIEPVAILVRFPLADYAIFGAVAASGAVTRFLWDCLREVSQFHVKELCLYFIFGVFMGNLVGSFIGIDHEYRDGLLLLSGFVVKELLEALDRYGGSTIARFLRVDFSSSILDKKESEPKTKTRKKRDEKAPRDE